MTKRGMSLVAVLLGAGSWLIVTPQDPPPPDPRFEQVSLLLRQDRPVEAEQLLDQMELRTNQTKVRLLDRQVNVYPLISELLIEAYLRVHDYANAERVAADRVTWTEGEYGESSLPVTGWLNRLAEINLLQGKYQEAEPVYLRSLSMHRSLKLDSCLMTRDLYTGLAEIYLALKRPVDAEQLLRSAIDTCPKKDSSRADLLNAYAITLEDNGRLEEAAKAALEADRVDTLDPRFKQEQRDLLRARLLASQGRFDEAVSLCRKWIAIFEVPESPESDRRLMLPLTEYERILRAAGRLSEAAEAGARLKEITTKYRRF